MKAAGVLFVGLLSLSAAAQAASFDYSVSTSSAIGGDVKSCPKFEAISVEPLDASGVGAKAMTIREEGRFPITMTGFSQTALSSIKKSMPVVTGYDDVIQLDAETLIGLERTSDGSFENPVTQPGHTAMRLNGIFAPGKTFICVYSLTRQ